MRNQHGKGRGLRMVVAGASAVLAATLGISSVRAVVVVNDTWQDSTRTDPAAPTYSEFGTDADADTDIESVWYASGTGATGTASPGHLVLTPTAGNSASFTTYFAPEATPVTLAQGDTLKVTWVFTPNTVNTSNTSQNFRAALVDSPAAARVSSDASPGTAIYEGYGIMANMGQTLGNSNPFQLKERDGTSGAFLSSSGSPPWTTLGNGATSGNHGYDSGTSYTMTWTLTRTPADALDINVSMVGGTLNGTGTASVSFLDTTPDTFTFDTFGIRPSTPESTAASFDTTSFKVETIVPEPASAALMLGAAGGLMLRRGRRSPR